MGKKIIKILVILLAALITYLGVMTYINKKEHVAQAQEVQQTMAKVEQMKFDLNKLKDEINKTEQLVVLEGVLKVEPTITDGDWMVSSDTRTILTFMKDKFKTLQAKRITINTELKYGFAYNMEDIEIFQEGNTVKIKLNKENLNVKYIETDETKTIIKEETRLLSGKFTKQELVAILARIKNDAHNYLMNNAETKDQAYQSIKDYLTKLCRGLGIDKIEFDSYEYMDTIENNEINVLNNSEVK